LSILFNFTGRNLQQPGWTYQPQLSRPS
jgi:hypothetical protein